MMSPDDLRQHIELLKAAGVSGPVEVHGVKFVIAPPPVEHGEAPPKKSLNADYDTMLFAATEGIPDEDAP